MFLGFLKSKIIFKHFPTNPNANWPHGQNIENCDAPLSKAKINPQITCFLCHFGHLQKVKTIKQHKNSIQGTTFLMSINSGLSYSPCLSLNAVSKSPVKNPAYRWQWLPWPIMIEELILKENRSSGVLKTYWIVRIF